MDTDIYRNIITFIEYLEASSSEDHSILIHLYLVGLHKFCFVFMFVVMFNFSEV